MAYQCFEVEVVDKVAHVRLSRPDELNSMTSAFWEELPRLVRDLDDRAAARVIVLSSTGRHFSAGMDLGVLAGAAGEVPADGGDGTDAGRQRAQLREVVLVLQDSFNALEQARVPVLAAVQGGCVGGALDLVTACDCRYASADAFFVAQEINLGMVADVGTLQRLPKLIPEGVARELAYTGRRLPAARAYELGLVNEVFADHDELVAGVLAIAGEIAARSPLAVWGTKEMITYARDHTVADGLGFVATWQAGMLQAGDLTESFTAKSEGRAPRFSDLLPRRAAL